jgi:hypothetical protein
MPEGEMTPFASTVFLRILPFSVARKPIPEAGHRYSLATSVLSPQSARVLRGELDEFAWSQMLSIHPLTFFTYNSQRTETIEAMLHLLRHSDCVERGSYDCRLARGDTAAMTNRRGPN